MKSDVQKSQNKMKPNGMVQQTPQKYNFNHFKHKKNDS